MTNQQLAVNIGVVRLTIKAGEYDFADQILQSLQLELKESNADRTKEQMAVSNQKA